MKSPLPLLAALAQLALAGASLAAQPELPPNHPPLDTAPRQAGPLPEASQARPPPGQPRQQQQAPGGGAEGSSPQPPLPPGHPPTTGSSGGQVPTTDSLLQQLDATPGLRERDKTFEMATNIARLYYGAGRFADALPYLEQAQGKARAVRELFVAQRKRLGKAPLPQGEPAGGCGWSETDALEARLRALQERVKKDAAGAAACARVALEPVLRKR